MRFYDFSVIEVKLKFEMEYYIHTAALTGIASAVLLASQANLAMSAVFEQLDNGTVVLMADGASSDAPSTGAAMDQMPQVSSKSHFGVLPAALAGRTKEQPDPVRPLGAVVVDMPASALAAASQSASPRPRRLPAMLSPQQSQMRLLAARVGLSYAREPAVARANLDEKSFVDLFTAMIRRESGFDANAVSPAGASGLGQLMPDTARELGVCDVFSARENLDGAARYLTSMLGEFRSPELALAAYNAGPAAVRQYGGVPPYPETRQYVADIVDAFSRGTDAYQELLAEGATAPSDRSPGGPMVATQFDKIVGARASTGCTATVAVKASELVRN
jgi:soluble lytic murein transglycosylase-like protein